MLRPFDRSPARLGDGGHPVPPSVARVVRICPDRGRSPASDGLRLGFGRVESRLSTAALRILETTWRLWREPRMS